VPAGGRRMMFKDTFKKFFTTDIDIVGMYTSTICAIHCLALPFLLVALPLAGITFIADLLWEIIFLLTAAVVGITAISRSFKIHGRKLPALMLSTGLMLLVASKIELSHSHEAFELHTFGAFLGGILIASAHYFNHRFKNSAFKKEAELELIS
jgi:uncharacterized membrane protein